MELPKPQFLSRRPSMRLVLIAGAISSLISLVLMFGLPSFDRAGKTLVVSEGPFRAGPVYTVSREGVTRLIVSVDGVGMQVIGMTELNDGSTVYALGDAGEAPISNLYRFYPDSRVEKLTGTPTAKFNLAVDPANLRVAYEEVPVSQPEDLLIPQKATVQELNVVTKDVRTRAQGIEPHYLKNGSLLVKTEQGTEVFQSSSDNATTVLPSNTHTQTTVDASGSRIAAYNTVTKSVDLFTLNDSGTLSYVQSLPVEQTPQNLLFVGDGVVNVTTTASSDGVVYQVSTIGKSGKVTSIEAKGGSLPAHILYVKK
jgi:hypothetical protein